MLNQQLSKQTSSPWFCTFFTNNSQYDHEYIVFPHLCERSSSIRYACWRYRVCWIKLQQCCPWANSGYCHLVLPRSEGREPTDWRSWFKSRRQYLLVTAVIKGIDICFSRPAHLSVTDGQTGRRTRYDLRVSACVCRRYKMDVSQVEGNLSSTYRERIITRNDATIALSSVVWNVHLRALSQGARKTLKLKKKAFPVYTKKNNRNDAYTKFGIQVHTNNTGTVKQQYGNMI